VLDPGDVEAIAVEIREEMGTDTKLPPVAIVGGANAHERPLSARMDTAALHMHFDNLEDRIERLEKTVASSVDLLHRLLHPEKANKSGTPGGY
jgi:hypothetical protein